MIILRTLVGLIICISNGVTKLGLSAVKVIDLIIEKRSQVVVLNWVHELGADTLIATRNSLCAE